MMYSLPVPPCTIQQLQLVFERFKIVSNPVKCRFEKLEVIFLDHHISSARISPIRSKLEAFSQFSAPTRKVCQFLGIINFFRRCLPNCTQIMKPSTEILTNLKNCDIVLSNPAMVSFFKIKSVLSRAIKLSHIISGKEFCLAVDASSTCVGDRLATENRRSVENNSFFL